MLNYEVGLWMSGRKLSRVNNVCVGSGGLMDGRWCWWMKDEKRLDDGWKMWKGGLMDGGKGIKMSNGTFLNDRWIKNWCGQNRIIFKKG